MNKQVLEMVLHNRHTLDTKCEIMGGVCDDLQKQTFDWIVTEFYNMLDSGVDPRDCDIDSLFLIMKNDIDSI